MRQISKWIVVSLAAVALLAATGAECDIDIDDDDDCVFFCDED